jgi:hypothetical protein
MCFYQICSDFSVLTVRQAKICQSVALSFVTPHCSPPILG